MRWKYYIPHRWESPDDRTTWEDVWLMPLEGGPELQGVSLWFTLDAILAEVPPELQAWLDGIEEQLEQNPELRKRLSLDEEGVESGESEPEPGEATEEGLAEAPEWRRIGELEYRVRPNLDMEIKTEDFNQHELLLWVKVFLVEHIGDPAPTLVEGTYEDFEGTNQQARNLDELGRRILEQEGLSESSSHGDEEP